ncbi:MAG: ATPase, T2SS/T4P/T4SS family [Deltaproteobacteria bacterium]|nr:ATPase, T2SS/T4P/T4SS family [Deltaproteobacteria bacterium]
MIGELLLRKGIITKDVLDKALTLKKEREDKKIGEILMELNALDEDTLYNVLSETFSLTLVDLKKERRDESLLCLFPASLMKALCFVPLRKDGNTLMVALSNPSDLYEISQIVRFTTNSDIRPFLAKDSQIREFLDAKGMKQKEETVLHETAFERELGEASVEVLDTEETVEESEEEQPFIIRLANHIILEALRREASDIHVEPYEKRVTVRYRIDGVLHVYKNLPAKIKNSLIQRIKIMSRMDITEKRVPQDGRIKINANVNGKIKSVDIRVSSVPTIFGEKIVMRILDREKLFLDLSQLGLEEESLSIFEATIRKPFGMILVTGPTGSGKTNTLYSAIQKINTPSVNIMTIEDPVEFVIPGINQVQVNETQGLTFSSALRSFLRQDPNIILVGEIRDAETLDIAVKASLTGHLVLSTLHTNDAPSTIARLIDMGVDRYLIGSSLLLVVAQRLVRKVCPECISEDFIDKRVLLSMGFSENELNEIKLVKGVGCEACSYTGYKGRTGLFEVLKVTSSIRELIFSGATTDEIRNKAISEGMITLRKSGLIKIKKGITTVEEVLRETTA